MSQTEWRDWVLLLISSYDERAPFVLNASLAVNLLYAIFKLIAGIWFHSFWMIGLGGYYGMLAIMRFLLIRQLRKEDPAAARRTYRCTAWLLLGLTIVMTGIIGQTFVSRETYDYPGVLIYAFVAYAFGKMITAVVSLILKRNHENRILAAARCVSFAQALMSILALQIALINRFGADSPGFARNMNGAAGAAICLLVILIAVLMLVKSSSDKRRTR